MHLLSGKEYYWDNPKPNDFNIYEIANALANTCRYNGQCQYYSVAEHSVLGSLCIHPSKAFHFMLHDAAESVLGDWPRPIKSEERMKWFRELENDTLDRIADAFCIDDIMCGEVKEIDSRIIKDEFLAIHPYKAGIVKEKPLGIRLRFWPPDTARIAYLKRIQEIVQFGYLDRDALMAIEMQLHDALYYLDR